jgi:hypothetical protein
VTASLGGITAVQNGELSDKARAGIIAGSASAGQGCYCWDWAVAKEAHPVLSWKFGSFNFVGPLGAPVDGRGSGWGGMGNGLMPA